MTVNLRLITRENFISSLGSATRPWHDDYLAMYSSWFDGFVTDPELMLIPVDDHLAHRGDGVFDVMLCVQGKIYQMEAHLDRLERSATAISIEFPPQYSTIREIIKSLVLQGGEKNCMIRVVLSRGPGGFSTNPFECPSSQMYINVIRYHSPPEREYREGISVITSKIPAKKSYFATIKSCNYLQNVLMKMEAINSGCKYSINLDDDGFLGEGSTENMGLVSKDGFFDIPDFENTLAGVTAKRVFELAEALKNSGLIKGVRFAKVSPEDVYLSSEVMLIGTSIYLLPVVNFDGRIIGDGSPGPVYSRLLNLLRKDTTENKDLLTDIEWESKK